jgi:hypothetical protein
VPSRRSSGRLPAAGQPEFLIDRSLGRLGLKAALQEVALTVRTLADVYGEAAYFVTNRFRIIQAAQKPGPYLYGAYNDGIKKLWPLEP